MPSSSPARRYRDILDYVDAITADVAEMTFDTFAQDGRTQRSVIYALQCISEAAVKLGYHAEEHAPDQDWPSIRGFGNVARHDYGAIDLGMVWGIVHDGLPPLAASCKRVLDAIEATPDRTRAETGQDP